MFKDTVIMVLGITLLGLVLVASMNGFEDIKGGNPFIFKNIWHEDIVPLEEKMAVNWHTKVLYVKVSEQLTLGDDGSCAAFGMVMLNMLEQMPDGWAIYVTNSWIPSKHNPIDLKWARVLAKGY